MIVKVLILVTLLQLCAGGGALNPEPQSKQAVSSQSFVRHDVPVSYQYSAVHVYSTPAPEHNKPDHGGPPHHFAQPQLPKEIQYAPIYNEQAGQYPNHRDVEVTVTPAMPASNVQPKKKPQLEPKPQEVSNYDRHYEHLSYVPGYNVRLFQAVNRYPGHNAVYRSYPNMSSNDKINKVNVLNQYILYRKPTEEQVTSAPEVISPHHQAEESTVTLSPFVPKENLQIAQRQQMYNPVQIASINAVAPPKALLDLQELVAHPKTHRMLINIARTYNIAVNPRKAQHASLAMLEPMPSHTQAIIRIPNPVDVDRNAKMLQIPNKLMHQFG